LLRCCSSLKRIVDSLVDGGLPDKYVYIAQRER